MKKSRARLEDKMISKDVVGEIYYEDTSSDPLRTLNKSAIRDNIERKTEKEWTINDAAIVYNDPLSFKTTKEVGEKLLDVVSFLETHGIHCEGKVAILGFKTGKITKVEISDLDGVAPIFQTSSF